MSSKVLKPSRSLLGIFIPKRSSIDPTIAMKMNAAGMKRRQAALSMAAL